MMSNHADDDTVNIFSAQFKSVLTFKKSDVKHFPPPERNVNRLVLCAGGHNCPGDWCRFVHADIADAIAEHEIHVNYAWRSLDEVSYARFPPGKTVDVSFPNNSDITMQIPLDQMLKTRFNPNAVQNATNRSPPMHCAHYYFSRSCNLGADCRFVHAVYIDPTAKPHQRTPVPTELGHKVLSKRELAKMAVYKSYQQAPEKETSNGSSPYGGYGMAYLRGAMSGLQANAHEMELATQYMAMDIPEDVSIEEHDISPLPRRYRHNPYAVAGESAWIVS